MQNLLSKGKGLFSGKKPDPKPIRFHDVPLTPPNKKPKPATEMTALGANRDAEVKNEGHPPGEVLDDEVSSVCCPLLARIRGK